MIITPWKCNQSSYVSYLPAYNSYYWELTGKRTELSISNWTRWSTRQLLFDALNYVLGLFLYWCRSLVLFCALFVALWQFLCGVMDCSAGPARSISKLSSCLGPLATRGTPIKNSVLFCSVLLCLPVVVRRWPVKPVGLFLTCLYELLPNTIINTFECLYIWIQINIDVFSIVGWSYVDQKG